MSIRQETATALRWSAGSRLATKCASWGITIVVIRLLDPADYGLMAMTMVVVGFARLFTDMGVNASIIRAPSLSDADLSAITSFNILVCVLMFALLYAVAPLVSGFFATDITAYVRVIALTFLVAPVGATYEALSTRAMDFKRRAFIENGAFLLGGVVSLAVAWAGHGVWALVLASLVYTVARSVGFVVLAPRHHWPSASLAGVRPHLRFGSLLVLQRLAWWLQGEIDLILLGRLLPADAVGRYSVARTLASLPADQLGQVLTQLPLAAFARVQAEPERLRDALCTSLRFLLLATVPVFFFMAVAADDLVAFMLGAKWAGVGPILAALSLAMTVRLVLTILSQALNAADQPVMGLVVNAILAVAGGLAIVAGAPFGIEVAAGAWALAYVLGFLVSVQVSGRLTGLTLVTLLALLWRPVLAAIAMDLAILGTLNLVPDGMPSWWRLCLAAGVGGSVFLAAILALDRKSVMDLIDFVRR